MSRVAVELTKVALWIETAGPGLEPAMLRSDDFDAFMRDRQQRLLD